MTDLEVRKIVSVTIEEFKEKELLKDIEEIVYKEMSENMLGYFRGQRKDKKITAALKSLKEDKYIDIIYMFYKDNYTVEHIAEKLKKETRTIYNHKKRLIIEIYRKTAGKKENI